MLRQELGIHCRPRVVLHAVEDRAGDMVQMASGGFGRGAGIGFDVDGLVVAVSVAEGFDFVYVVRHF